MVMKDRLGRPYTEWLTEQVGSEMPIYKLAREDPLLSMHTGFFRTRDRSKRLSELANDPATSEEVKVQIAGLKGGHWRYIWKRKSQEWLTEQPTRDNFYLGLITRANPKRCGHPPDHVPRPLPRTPSDKLVVPDRSLEPAESGFLNDGSVMCQGWVPVCSSLIQFQQACVGLTLAAGTQEPCHGGWRRQHARG